MLNVGSVRCNLQKAIESEDDCEFLRTLNQVREWLYALYPRVDVAPVKQLCIDLNCFPQCGSCPDSYQGFTLPRGLENAEKIAIDYHWNNARIKSHWRHYSPCDGVCGDTATKLPEKFALERECMTPEHLNFKALGKSDWGKTITLAYTDDKGRERHEQYTLDRKPVRSLQPVQFPLHAGSISFQGIENGVEVYSDNHMILSRYGCNEVPAYTRYKLDRKPCTESCSGQAIITAESRFTPVTHDDDPIEVCSTLVYDYLAKAVVLSRKSNLTGEERNTVNWYEQQALELIVGLKTREQGKAVETRLDVPVFRPGSRKLHRRVRL